MSIRSNHYQVVFAAPEQSSGAIGEAPGAAKWLTGEPAADPSVSLVLAFGDVHSLLGATRVLGLASLFPNAAICGCTTAGQIVGQSVIDEPLLITTLSFDATTVTATAQRLDADNDSRALGALLGTSLPHQNLKHVIVLSDGLNVNGSALVDGIVASLPRGVSATGGLAGDGPHFERTCLLFGDEVFDRGAIAIGLYGEQLEVSYGSLGGWDPFGPERVVTKATANVLYELDGRSALGLYKQYLDHHASGLPASGLLFPLSVRCKNANEPFVRTILSVSETDQSITFAGDVPVGAIARFMKANTERLVDGAADAAGIASVGLGCVAVDFALLVSCVGRRLVLKQRTEDELEAVAKALGYPPLQVGFYSYGEIAPFMKHAKTALHNQTMTVTAFRERNGE